MKNFQNFNPSSLKVTPEGDKYLPLNFKSNQEVVSMFCKLTSALKVISKMAQENGTANPDDILHGIEGITKVLKSISWGMYDDFVLLDKLSKEKME